MPGLRRWRVDEIADRLRAHYGPPPAPATTDPFGMAVWEACAYLVPDERRRAVFDRLRKATGLVPVRLAALPRSKLVALIADGGMQPEHRALKVRRAADLAIEHGTGPLRTLCRGDPGAAKRIFRQFPGIGEPGAEKILLFNGAGVGLAPDSNGLRVLLRLGFGRDTGGYSARYRSVREALTAEPAADRRQRIEAHLLLRQHGQTLCQTSGPLCDRCPLSSRCPAALTAGGNGPGRDR